MAWRPLVTVHNLLVTLTDGLQHSEDGSRNCQRRLGSPLSFGRKPSIVPNGSDLHSTTLERQMNPQHYQDEVCEPQPGPSCGTECFLKPLATFLRGARE
uniref:Putative secreted protein n=1 Tax=Ixodes ricinus TaxID=34613 RepID=A0A6B0UB73_IXORI